MGSVLGIWGGCIVGGMTWFYVKKGWKTFTYSLYIFTILVGLFILGIGLVALLTRQPYHVWFLFVLSGAITAAVVGGIFPVIPKRFAQREQQIMAIEDL